MTITKRLEDVVENNDYVQHLGDDKYLVCMSVLKENLKTVEATTDKLIALISNPISIKKDMIEVGARFGLSAYPIHGNKAAELLYIAEMKKLRLS